MVAGHPILLLILSLYGSAIAHGAESPETTQARNHWARSPHGAMLERILPPAVEPQQLPEPRSEGAQLMSRYCVQCHYLPSPQMHAATRWPSVVDRMVWRMRGQGNMGALMKDMMANVTAPSAAEIATLSAYLHKHAQREIDPKHPALQTRAGQIYSLACSQCHALPDPQRHTAEEWARVIKRMQGHMAWATTIVGVRELRTNPELDTAEILRLLQQYARRDNRG
jgi:cytochrome c5